MNPRIKVLVVDDSVIIRRILTEVLSEDPEIEVMGSAPHGRIALAKIEQSMPDLVTLDVEMPEMDGIATLREIRKLHPKLPVIMFSTKTERGASTTLQALTLGASDYLTKPEAAEGISEARDRVRAELGGKVKALVRRLRPDLPRTPDHPVLTVKAAVPRQPTPTARRIGLPPQVLAIGSSTGGPNALAELLAALPGSFPLPILITQHMPPMFTRMLADRLTNITPFVAKEGAPGDEPAPGHIYIAPGDHHMVAVREGTRVVLQLNHDPPECSCRPSVDVMLRSVVAAYGGRVLVTILTGMGQDGLRGCELLAAKGAQILAQDEASSVVWGMPGFVANAGLADAVLPLRELAPEIARRVKSPFLEGRHAAQS